MWKTEEEKRKEQQIMDRYDSCCINWVFFLDDVMCMANKLFYY